MLRRGSILFGLFWLAAFADASLAFAGPAAASGKTLRFSITLTNQSGARIDAARLNIFGPLAAPGPNSRITAANEPYREEVDALGNRAVLFDGLSFPPYASRRFVLTFELDNPTSPYPASPPAEIFLAPEPLIESSAVEIIRQAARLLAEGDKGEFPRRAFQWVADHVRYQGFLAEDRGALYALREAKGDCTEYASLFVALMRAARIPARVVGGWVVQGSGLAKAADYHNWAEYYVDGSWHLADPQRRVFGQSQDYVVTRIVHRSSGDVTFPYRYEVEPATLKVTWD